MFLTVDHQAPLSMEFSRQDTGVGCHFLLQGIFPTKGSNLGLLHCREILYQLSHQGSSNIYTTVYKIDQSAQFNCSVVSDSLPPHGCSTPGFPVHHQLPELAQTHVHRVSDAIQLSHSLSSPSPSAFNLSQHQGLFQWVSSLHQVAKALELQHQSFQ